jgi:phospho-N-acetylmuramoyl-pentapeptide-transferase
MGDTGSQALGGALASLALLTKTQLLVVLLGGLYVTVALSVVLQVFSFRVFGKRIFRMAPLHHHFELRGWPESTVNVRFWIIAGLFVAVGVGVFYADFLIVTDVGILP